MCVLFAEMMVGWYRTWNDAFYQKSTSTHLLANIQYALAHAIYFPVHLPQAHIKSTSHRFRGISIILIIIMNRFVCLPYKCWMKRETTNKWINHSFIFFVRLLIYFWCVFYLKVNKALPISSAQKLVCNEKWI